MAVAFTLGLVPVIMAFLAGFVFFCTFLHETAHSTNIGIYKEVLLRPCLFVLLFALGGINLGVMFGSIFWVALSTALCAPIAFIMGGLATQLLKLKTKK